MSCLCVHARVKWMYANCKQWVVDMGRQVHLGMVGGTCTLFSEQRP